jgi:hypothetical protein
MLSLSTKHFHPLNYQKYFYKKKKKRNIINFIFIEEKRSDINVTFQIYGLNQSLQSNSFLRGRTTFC